MLDTEKASEVTRAKEYLCDVCESIKGLEHEVRPAALPYVSGDYQSVG